MTAAVRPVIGIAISPPEDGSPYYNLNPEYSDAIWRAGGSPIAFPLIADKEYVQQVFTQVHGLLLTGSKYDLDPALYGQVSHDRSSVPNRDRDNLDHLLLQRAVESRMPVLGICHGCQAINVALGGSLIQDIPSQANGNVNHCTTSDTGEYAHEIMVEPGSILNGSVREATHAINSAHHQAVEVVAPGLKATGHAPDGIIEIIESVDSHRHFVLGLQWHPEKLAAGDDFSARPFTLLVEAAVRWQSGQL